MNYLKIYNNLIEIAKTRNSEAGYGFEKHHIIPKCLGGLDDNENIAVLSCREHFVAHQLLVKIYPDHPGISYSAVMMTRAQNNFLHLRVNNRLYEWLKKKESTNKSKSRKGLTKNTCKRIAKMAKTKQGQTKDNCESVRKRSASFSSSQTGKTKETSDRVAKMANTMKEKWANYSDEEKELRGIKISAKLKGKPKPEGFGYKISNIHKGKTKETDEGVRKSSETRSKNLKGQTRENNERVKKMTLTMRMLSPELELLVFNMRNSGYSALDIIECLKKQGINIARSTIYKIAKRVQNDIDLGFISFEQVTAC